MLPDNPDDQARLFYLIVLGVVIAGSMLFGRGGRLGKTLKDLIVWGLIFAMVVIAYGFRDTLRSALFPSGVVQISDEVLELKRGLNGHFQARVLVNGEAVEFIVDTGATDIVLSQRDARAAGIDVEGLNFVGRASTANGIVHTARVRLDTVRLGDFEERDVGATVGSGALDVSLLGMSYLNRYSRLEITGDRMRLYR